MAATGALLLPAHLARTQEATPAVTSEALTEEEQAWLSQASRQDINGWIHLRIGGAPFARGFQHGNLTAAEYSDALRVYEAMTYQTMGFEYGFFVEKAVSPACQSALRRPAPGPHDG